MGFFVRFSGGRLMTRRLAVVHATNMEWYLKTSSLFSARKLSILFKDDPDSTFQLHDWNLKPESRRFKFICYGIRSAFISILLVACWNHQDSKLKTNWRSQRGFAIDNCDFLSSYFLRNLNLDCSNKNIFLFSLALGKQLCSDHVTANCLCGFVFFVLETAILLRIFDWEMR